MAIGTGYMPYTTDQLNNPALPQSVRDQMQSAQMLQQAASANVGPYSSGGVNALRAMSGLLGGQQEAHADQAAAPYLPASSQPAQSVLGQLLQGGSGASTPGAPTQLPGALPTTDPTQDPSSSGSGILGTVGRKSDRRLKSEISRIGTLASGLPVYVYRLEGGPFEVGCMADEVALVCPDATWFDPDDGFARVDYAKVA